VDQIEALSGQLAWKRCGEAVLGTPVSERRPLSPSISKPWGQTSVEEDIKQTSSLDPQE
jgi:hypothetical protein